MKRKIGVILLMLFIFLIATISFAGTIPLMGSNLMETKIGNIKLFDKKRTVLIKLGKPIKSSFDKLTSSTEIYYKGLKIGLDSDGNVIAMESTSNKFPIYRGVSVGDKKSIIAQRYGKPSFATSDRRVRYLQYNSTDYQGWVYCIRFYIVKEKVVKITLFDPWGNGL